MVAMNVWPTDGADGSVATEARWRKMARLWVADGVVDNVGGEMAPSLAFPNLTVQAGAAWVDGHYTELPGSQVLAVTANGIVVVRFDPAANTAELLYRDGATTPTQTVGGIWEILIASMSGSAMTDRRGALLSAGAYERTFFRVIGGTTQGIAASTPVVATFASEVADASNVIVGGLFTCPAGLAGRWYFDWSVSFPGPATGIRNVFLTVNPAAARYGQVTIAATPNDSTVIAGSTMVNMAGGNQAYVGMYHTHSGGLACNGSVNDHFQGYYLGPA